MPSSHATYTCVTGKGNLCLKSTAGFLAWGCFAPVELAESERGPRLENKESRLNRRLSPHVNMLMDHQTLFFWRARLGRVLWPCLRWRCVFGLPTGRCHPMNMRQPWNLVMHPVICHYGRVEHIITITRPPTPSKECGRHVAYVSNP